MDLVHVYCGRRALVTGHTGFKGAWLCTWLLDLGADVTGLALDPHDKPNLFDALGLAGRMTSLIGDIRDVTLVQNVFNQVRPEIVFHLAAQSLVQRSYAEPIETFATNILGTAHVLNAARATSSVRAVVNVTTDKVYEDREWCWPYREIDSLGGLDPYSASKACAELISAAYQKNLCRKDRTVEIATARGGNVIGGGDWGADRLVPDIVRAVVSGQPIILRNPTAVRPWQHVLELCEAYLELGARLLNSERLFAEAWNFGPWSANEITVNELTRAMLRSWQRPAHPIETRESPFHESQVLRLDISKSVSRLDWRPRLAIVEALDMTAQWYIAYYDNARTAHTFTLEQIHEFKASAIP
jgi:CDP-glucose 4,6-dehydratase